jgi:hypothetical protein
LAAATRAGIDVRDGARALGQRSRLEPVERAEAPGHEQADDGRNSSGV